MGKAKSSQGAKPEEQQALEVVPRAANMILKKLVGKVWGEAVPSMVCRPWRWPNSWGAVLEWLNL